MANRAPSHMYFVYAYDDDDDLMEATGLGMESKQSPPSGKQAPGQTIPTGECRQSGGRNEAFARMDWVDANDDDDAGGRGATGPGKENGSPSHIYF
eukprot:1516506-Karenia_brevis.AAC.1